jgi:PAS domain S-box-containing protein
MRLPCRLLVSSAESEIEIFPAEMNSMTPLSGNYDYRLVALSVLLAIFASYAALDLAGRITSAKGKARMVWLSCGAAAMGLGVWAMHYVGMLALLMPMPVFYHLPTVALSLLAAIAASGAALFVVSRIKMGLWQGIAGSIVMGSGIAAMHYVGMAAMRCAAVISYDLRIVALSVALAIVISLVALQLAFRLRLENRSSWRKVISALVMGSAIPLMHYTGMWAATFHPSGIAPDLEHSIDISTIGVAAISACSFMALAGAIGSSFLDRLMALQKTHLNLARERELYFQTMAEAVPEIIWTATPQGEDDYFNQKCFDYTGMSFEQLKGSAWKTLVHPDDLDNCFQQWQTALQTGEPYNVEYRLRSKEGVYRWFVGRQSHT